MPWSWSTCRAGIRERHQVELELELHRYHLLAPLAPEAEAELKDLRAQVEKMGEINLTAIDEHAELSKRFDFLSTQKKDLQASLEQLKEAIYAHRRDEPRALQADVRRGEREVPGGVPAAVRRRAGQPGAHQRGARAPSRAWRSSRSRRARSCRA